MRISSTALEIMSISRRMTPCLARFENAIHDGDQTACDREDNELMWLPRVCTDASQLASASECGRQRRVPPEGDDGCLWPVTRTEGIPPSVRRDQDL